MSATTAPLRHDVPSYGAAALAGLAVLALYVATLAPTTALWDASEYITAAYTLGIPHPPGNPLFVILGRVASLVPLGSVAVRVNMLAAVSSAFSCAVWFLVTERVLSGWLPLRWTRLLAAAVATLLSATAFTVWNQSVVNEKVYTVSLAFFAVVSWLTVLWCDDPDGRRADRILVVIAYLIGLGYSNHPAGFLVAPAVAVAVLARRPRTVLRWRLLLAAAAALVFGLTPFAIVSIRAAHHPAMNQGEATGCTTSIGFACTFSETTVTRLKAHVNREQYGKPDLAQRQAPFTAQAGMWWLYFKWQWLRDAEGEQQGTQTMLAVLFLGLGIAGGVVHWRRDRASFWFFGPLVATITIVLVYYMNFKYGASQDPGLTGVEREVRDRDYFYLWSYSAWSVWVALGLAALWHHAVQRVRGEGGRRWIMAAPVLLLGLVPLIGNWRDASRAGETAPREWAHDLLNSVEPYGILVTHGDNDTFPLWYAQQVEGVRPDVTVAVTSLLNTDWYIRSLMRQPTVRYDAARGPAVYRTREWPMPTTPLLAMSVAQVDAIPEYVDLRTPQLFQAGGIRALVDPGKLEYGVPVRADILVLQMLKDNLGTRPLYMARTGGNYVNALGLGPYALSQGLATKIMSAPVAATADVVPVRGLGHVDVPRTRALWDAYGAPAAVAARGNWVDRPSISIPLSYISIALLMGDVLEQAGGTQEAMRFRTAGLEMARATRTLDLFVDPNAAQLPASGDSSRGSAVPVTP